MSLWAALGGVGAALAVNECCELSPWAADKVVRWAAHLRYADPERAGISAEELSALVKARPGKLLKLITALCFAAAAIRAWAGRAMAGLSAGHFAVSASGVVTLRRAAAVAAACTAAVAFLTVPSDLAREPAQLSGASQRPPAPVVRVSEAQGAASVAALLAQSVGTRSAVVNAYNDVMQCGPGLRQDAQVFWRAAASRRSLVSQLSRMPSRSALPTRLTSNLTEAWKSSARADRDFARWARDEAAAGCNPGESDPNFQAATGPDLQATQSHKAVAAGWDPIARRYGLATYQEQQI